MKKYILNAIAIFTFATGLSSCGDSFLETDNYKGVDLEGGLNTVTNVSTALNGTYYQLFYYAFAGNYALAIEGGNLAASKIRNLECPSYEICLIDYGCGKFNRKIHIMEQYP